MSKAVRLIAEISMLLPSLMEQFNESLTPPSTVTNPRNTAMNTIVLVLQVVTVCWGREMCNLPHTGKDNVLSEGYRRMVGIK